MKRVLYLIFSLGLSAAVHAAFPFSFWHSPASSGAMSFTDSFTRADAPTLGGNWDAVSGAHNLTIVSNQANTGGSDAGTAYQNLVDAGTYSPSVDQSISVTTGNAAYYYVFFRSTSASNGYFAFYDQASGLVTVYKNGTATFGPSSVGSWTAGQVLMIQANGTSTTTIDVYINGIGVVSYNDTSSPITASGQVGFGIYAPTTATTAVSFSATNLP